MQAENEYTAIKKSMEKQAMRVRDIHPAENLKDFNLQRQKLNKWQYS